MPRLTTAPGVELHYTEAGSGRPVVLVHGWSMTAAAFSPVAVPLAARTRVIALDLRGHGSSTAAGGQSLAEHARDLEAVFDRLDLRDAVLVGWSMGGQVALEAWPLLAGRVAGLALLGVTPRFASAPGWEHGLPPATVEALAARLRHRFQPSLRRFFDAMFAPDELLEPERRALADAVLGESALTPATALAGLEALLAADQRPRLAEVRVPVLLLHGERDPICLPAASAYLEQELPSARRQVLLGLGHAPQLSRPGLVAELVLRFVAELG